MASKVAIRDEILHSIDEFEKGLKDFFNSVISFTSNPKSQNSEIIESFQQLLTIDNKLQDSTDRLIVHQKFQHKIIESQKKIEEKDKTIQEIALKLKEVEKGLEESISLGKQMTKAPVEDIENLSEDRYYGGLRKKIEVDSLLNYAQFISRTTSSSPDPSMAPLFKEAAAPLVAEIQSGILFAVSSGKISHKIDLSVAQTGPSSGSIWFDPDVDKVSISTFTDQPVDDDDDLALYLQD